MHGASSSGDTSTAPDEAAGLLAEPYRIEPERNARISGPVIAACVLAVLALGVLSFAAFSGESGAQAGPSGQSGVASDGDLTVEGMPGDSAFATSDPTADEAGVKRSAPAGPNSTAPTRTTGAPGTAASVGTGDATRGTGGDTAEQGTSTTASPGAAGRVIVGSGSSRCIEVAGRSGTDGSPLRLWDCGGDDWQKWVLRSDGSIRSLGLCMDIANASTANGTVIQLARCNGGWAQQFALDGAHHLVNAQSAKCVDVTDAATGNGARLQLWDCADTSNQKWHLR
ncbi:RICIN domain-containing protein [Streptomyces coerulescens]|uniref:RICIN domain-containing protein n=1 Tax=Streptomyces coerulescens TaxID=29304 RepID=A0ABW0CUV7_STRCD